MQITITQSMSDYYDNEVFIPFFDMYCISFADNSEITSIKDMKKGYHHISSFDDFMKIVDIENNQNDFNFLTYYLQSHWERRYYDFNILKHFATPHNINNISIDGSVLNLYCDFKNIKFNKTIIEMISNDVTIRTKDFNDMVPLLLYCKNVNVAEFDLDIIRILANEYTICEKDADGQNALHLYCKRSTTINKDIIKILTNM